MDQFLSKLNLQNLLRQFCCGIVFFVPLYLFVPCKINAVWKRAELEEHSLICVAALAFIIGTVIYHLEKNLYSYAIQSIFKKQYGVRSAKYLLSILYLLCLVALPCSYWIFNESLHNIILCIGIIALIVAIVAIIIVFWDSKDLTTSTQTQWEIESHSTKYTERDWAIADKVAVWSDFIHCVQSSCFAWIAGALVAAHYSCFGKGRCICCASKDTVAYSVGLAVCLLLIELGIDWHRYRHVLYLTEERHKGTRDIVYIRMSVSYRKKESWLRKQIRSLINKS